MQIIKITLLIYNILCFISMGFDKYRAVKHRYRTPERSFMIMNFTGGCFGILIGMFVFHHKVRKPKFYILVPCSCILYGIIIIKALVL